MSKVEVYAWVIRHERMDDTRFTMVTVQSGSGTTVGIPVPAESVKDFLVGTHVRLELKKATEP